MKIYELNGKTYDRLPDPCMGCSPMTDEKFIALGGTITDDGTCWSKKELEFQALPCCARFNAVCSQIGVFLGVPDFDGGYDSIDHLTNSKAAQDDPVRAHTLALLWQAADDDCNYRAQKLGIGRPRWWYCCRNIDPDKSAS